MKLVVDKGHQLPEGVLAASLPFMQQPRDVGCVFKLIHNVGKELGGKFSPFCFREPRLPKSARMESARTAHESAAGSAA